MRRHGIIEEGRRATENRIGSTPFRVHLHIIRAAASQNNEKTHEVYQEAPSAFWVFFLIDTEILQISLG